MKKMATIFATTALVGLTSAYAANPFSDVSSDSWAYQSVAQLANSGIINGYPDGTFKGQNDITRFEMAQMVAKAMANQDRANAEQQAMINRLADEFSSELNNLGVRVANLEDRVGNIKATGDVRFRYLGGEHGDDATATTTPDYPAYGKHSKFQLRGRIQFNAQINKDTKAVIQFNSGDTEFGDSKSSSAYFDRVYVQHKFGPHTTVTAGRYMQKFGAGLSYFDTFDGIQAAVGNDKLNLQAAYGYMMAGSEQGNDQDKNPEVAYVGLSGKLGRYTNLGGFYARVGAGSFNIADDTGHTGFFKKQAVTLSDSQNVYGFNANVNYKKTWLGGEWIKASSLEDAQAWMVGAGYGNYNIRKANTWKARLQYFKQEANAPVFNSLASDQPFDLRNTARGYQGWMATVDYALMNNVGLTAKYGFNSKEVTGSDKDLGDFYRVELNYVF